MERSQRLVCSGAAPSTSDRRPLGSATVCSEFPRLLRVSRLQDLHNVPILSTFVVLVKKPSSHNDAVTPRHGSRLCPGVERRWSALSQSSKKLQVPALTEFHS